MLECALVFGISVYAYNISSGIRQYTHDVIRDKKRNVKDRISEYMTKTTPRTNTVAQFECVRCKNQYFEEFYNLQCHHLYCKACFFDMLRYTRGKKLIVYCHACNAKYHISNFIGYGNPIYIVPEFKKEDFYIDNALHNSMTKPNCKLCGEKVVDKKRLISCHCPFCAKCIDRIIERDNEAGRLPNCPSCAAPMLFHNDVGQYKRNKYYMTEGVNFVNPNDDF